MKVFISYHRADTKFRRKTENILRSHSVDYYVVPEDADFNGQKPEAIRSFLCEQLSDCDVLLCLIGNETYSRPHVDREIHTALKGFAGQRLGIVAVHLPTRNDSLDALNVNTISPKLWDNKEYVVWTNWSSLNSRINLYLRQAVSNSNDKKLQTNHQNPCMALRNKRYYDDDD